MPAIVPRGTIWGKPGTFIVSVRYASHAFVDMVADEDHVVVGWPLAHPVESIPMVGSRFFDLSAQLHCSPRNTARSLAWPNQGLEIIEGNLNRPPYEIGVRNSFFYSSFQSLGLCMDIGQLANLNRSLKKNGPFLPGLEKGDLEFRPQDL